MPAAHTPRSTDVQESGGGFKRARWITNLYRGDGIGKTGRALITHMESTTSRGLDGRERGVSRRGRSPPAGPLACPGLEVPKKHRDHPQGRRWPPFHRAAGGWTIGARLPVSWDPRIPRTRLPYQQVSKLSATRRLAPANLFLRHPKGRRWAQGYLSIGIVRKHRIVAGKLGHQFLHGQTALQVKRHLFLQPGVLVASAPYRLETDH